MGPGGGENLSGPILIVSKGPRIQNENNGYANNNNNSDLPNERPLVIDEEDDEEEDIENDDDARFTNVSSTNNATPKI